jgi:hypothetical protein
MLRGAVLPPTEPAGLVRQLQKTSGRILRQLAEAGRVSL